MQVAPLNPDYIDELAAVKKTIVSQIQLNIINCFGMYCLKTFNVQRYAMLLIKFMIITKLADWLSPPSPTECYSLAPE